MRKISEEGRFGVVAGPLELDLKVESPRSVASTRSGSHEQTLAFESLSNSGFSDTKAAVPRPPSAAWPEVAQVARDASAANVPLPIACPVKEAAGKPASTYARVQRHSKSSDDIDKALTGTVLNTGRSRGSGTPRSKGDPPRKSSAQVRIGNKAASDFSPLSRRRMDLLAGSRPLALRVLRSRAYGVLSMVFIVLNALFVMWETESRARLAAEGKDSEPNNMFGAAACVFCAIFVSDVILRLVAEQRRFFVSRERYWNLFDVFVSLTATAEVAVYCYERMFDTSSLGNLRIFLRRFSMLRILRLLEVIRKTRSAQVMRFIRELRLMVFCLTGSLRTFFWAVVLILFFVLVFGVYFTDGAIDFCVANGVMEAESTQDLRKYFGTLSASTASLYMAMSGGAEWSYIMHSLDPLPSEYRILFLVFVTFAILALLNVVTAVFVGTAMQQAQADREMQVLLEMEQQGEFVSLMQQVFEELDTNGSGALSLEEFEKHIEDERVLAYLRTQHIDISQVRTLFTLLDVDRTGEVDMDEFVGGCLRIRGGATGMDLAVLKYQVEWILHGIQNLTRTLCPDMQSLRPKSRSTVS